MTVAEVRPALRRPAAQAGVAADAARDGPRRVDPGGDRGDHAAHGAPRPRADRHARTCAWPAASRSTASANGRSCARARSRTSGSSRRPATPAARSARRCSSGTSCSDNRAQPRRPTTRSTARCSGRASRDDEIRAFLDARRRRLPALRRRGRAAATTVAELLAEREGRRLVPGPHGVRAARARRPQHPRRRAQPEDAVDDEPQDQVPRVVPALRARACCEERVDEYFEMRPSEDSPYMLLVAPVQRDKRARRDRARTALQGIDKLKRAPLASSRRSPTSTTRRASRPSTPSGTAASTS